MSEDTNRILERIAALEGELVELRQQVTSSLVHRELPTGDIAVMVCRIGAHEFGVLLDDVDEVVPVAQLTPLPEADPWILGSLNLRGESVVVVDAMQRLLERAHVIHDTEFIVVCWGQRGRIGLLVTDVLDIETFAPEGLRHPAPGMSFATYLFGIIFDDERSLPLVDATKLASIAPRRHDDSGWDPTE